MHSHNEKRSSAGVAGFRKETVSGVSGNQAHRNIREAGRDGSPGSSRDVLTAAQERVRYVFENFDNIYVSFSGGKDSGVLLNLAITEARKLSRKIGVFHIDYEAQYQMTTDFVDAQMAKDRDVIEPLRCCLPLSVPCCTSMHQDHWVPWGKEKKDLWVRALPAERIDEDSGTLPFFTRGMWDYDFQEQFGPWLHKRNKANRTACLVGIRTQESFNRWRAIHSDRNYRNFRGVNWTKQIIGGVFNAYPIFDWKTEDIWTANARFGWDYNKLYDLFYQAGVGIDKMRVASPFISQSQDSLKYYKAIDPKNWGKMIGRVNGVNFTGIYGGTTAMGWRSVKLPEGQTWKGYMEFLLSTLPGEVAENYKKKLEKSRQFWRERGGCLSAEVQAKLHANGIDFKTADSTNYDTDKRPVLMEYLDDIDIPEFTEIPTYKRMCVCIMKNDHLCKFMGFSLTKTETLKRTEALEKYKHL